MSDRPIIEQEKVLFDVYTGKILTTSNYRADKAKKLARQKWVYSTPYVQDFSPTACKTWMRKRRRRVAAISRAIKWISSQVYQTQYFDLLGSMHTFPQCSWHAQISFGFLHALSFSHCVKLVQCRLKTLGARRGRQLLTWPSRDLRRL